MAPPPAVSASGHSVQVAVKKKIREPAQSRFGAAAAATSGRHSAGPQTAHTAADVSGRSELGLDSAAATGLAVASVPVSVTDMGNDVIKASRPDGALGTSPATPAELAARKKADALAAQQKKDADLVEARRKVATAAAGSSLANAAAGRAAALTAKSGSDNEEEEDVQLSAEELGFPSESVDAFAGK